MREHFTRVLAEAQRLTGFSPDDLMGRSREEPLATVRHSVIRAIFDRCSRSERGQLAYFFGRDRTSITYSAGKRTEKPVIDQKLVDQIGAYLDSLLAGDPGRPKRKITVTPKLIAHLHKARAALREKAAARGSQWKSEESRRRSVMAGTACMNLYRDKAALVQAAKRKIPDSGDPLVRTLFKIMRRERAILREVQGRIGVAARTMSAWRSGRRQPTIGNLTAAFNAMGYRITVVPIDGDEEEAHA